MKESEVEIETRISQALGELVRLSESVNAMTQSDQDELIMLTVVRLYDELDSIRSAFPALSGQEPNDGFVAHRAFVTQLAASAPKALSRNLALVLHEQFVQHLKALESTVKRLYPEITLSGKAISLFRRSWGRLVAPYRVQWTIAILCGLVVFGLAYQRRSAFLRTHGLIGEYYSDRNFEKFVRSRKDPRIDFDWSYRGPFSNMPEMRDWFSIRWTGMLNVPYTAKYEISIQADDESAVWIDGQKVLSSVRWNQRYTYRVPLTKGPHSIRVDYVERDGRALVHLYWRGDYDKEASIIDTKFLTPS